MLVRESIYEAIKHLTPRSSEEIEEGKRASYEEKLVTLDENIKKDIIDLCMALDKQNIKIFIYFNDRNKDYELRIDDYDPIKKEQEYNDAYNDYSFAYITEETINLYSLYLNRCNITTPGFFINRRTGSANKLELYTQDWKEVYYFILRKKNEYLEKQIANLKDAIKKLQKNKVKI